MSGKKSSPPFMFTITAHALHQHPHLVQHVLTIVQSPALATQPPGLVNILQPHLVQRMLTIVQPAATAILPAVSFVAIPPVPHCVPFVLVSALSVEKSSTSEIGLASGSSCSGQLCNKHFL